MAVSAGIAIFGIGVERVAKQLSKARGKQEERRHARAQKEDDSATLR